MADAMPWEDDGATGDTMPWEEPTAAPVNNPNISGGHTANFFKGLVNDVTSLPGTVMNAANDLFPGLQLMEAAPTVISHAITKKPLTDIEAQMLVHPGQTMTQQLNKGVEGATGFNPDKVKTNTVGDMFWNFMGGAAPFMLNPEGGLPGMAKNIATNLGVVAGQTGAQAAFPKSQVASTVGGLLSGLATGKLTQAPATISRYRAGVNPEDAAHAYVSDVAESAGATPASIAQAGVDAQGKPIIGAEAIGRPGITATRALGLRQGTTGDALNAQLKERALGTGDRIKADFEEATGVNPDAALGDIKGMVKNGQASVRPLYEKAYEGKSTAPLEHAFTEQFDTDSRAVKDAQTAMNDASNQMTLAEAKIDAAGDNVYLLRSARDQRAAAEAQMERAQTQLSQAETSRDANLDRLRQAQADRANGVKGGIWSPYLQRLMNNPNIRKGMARGYAIERDIADAANTPFSPTDLAITGEDASGAPIVRGVPNMKVLDMGKRGLDAIISDYADPATGRLNMRDPRVKPLLDLRTSYLNEIDRLNPDFKAARAAAGDYLSAENAFQRAQTMFKSQKVSGKQFQDFLDGLNTTDRKAAVGGVANHLFDLAEKGKLKGSDFSMPQLQKKLTGIVDDPAKVSSLLQKMNTEAEMAKTGQRMSPGLNSTTFESEAAASDQDKFHAASLGMRAMWNLMHGRLIRAGELGLSAAARAGYGFSKSPGMPIPIRNAAGKLFMMPPNELAASLARYQASKQAALLARPKFPTRGLLPAINPAITQGSSYLSGGNQ